jgi:phage terminase large subunit-like protein
METARHPTAGTAQRLQRRGVPMVEFPQSVPNITAASQNLYELIKSQGIVGYADADIRLALQRAVAVEGARGWKIDKSKGSHKIDVVIALGMAALAAVQKGESAFLRIGTCKGGVGKIDWKDTEPMPLRIERVSEEEFKRRNGLP